MFNLVEVYLAISQECHDSGEPLNEETIYNWEEATGLVVKEGYGQTETTLLLGTFKVSIGYSGGRSITCCLLFRR